MTPPSEGNELLDHAERLQTRAGPRTLQFEADIRIQGFRIRSRNADREPHPNSPQDYKHQTLEYPLEVKTNPTEANMRSFRRKYTPFRLGCQHPHDHDHTCSMELPESDASPRRRHPYGRARSSRLRGVPPTAQSDRNRHDARAVHAAASRHPAGPKSAIRSSPEHATTAHLRSRPTRARFANLLPRGPGVFATPRAKLAFGCEYV